MFSFITIILCHRAVDIKNSNIQSAFTFCDVISRAMLDLKVMKAMEKWLDVNSSI